MDGQGERRPRRPLGRDAAAADRLSLRRLRAHCDRQLAQLGVAEMADLTELISRIESSRRRPLKIAPLDRADGPCGLWLEFDDADLVLYRRSPSRFHQNHIIAHELAHILCGHRGHEAINDDTAAVLFPDLDPAMVRGALRRTTYGDAQEREAEVMATMLMRRLPATADVAPSPSWPGGDEVLDRLVATLAAKRR